MQAGLPLIDKGEALKYIEDKTGEVSEWSKEAVLKTVEPQGSVGSNPTFSGAEAVSVNRERCESGRIGLPAKELYS